ncbi:3884_t:CDS:2 [Racocetra persica]|uniref:3883_t:CDS:1 n=2 Tax=Racocetra persica TaxID=160502 RepID=A0ACA9L344_9GLOM|nr:3883_t:CDS:2 [Racocetra persica]CAG8508512.1 3884_t:CDS:2 [Racocetra persica]
MKLERVAQHQRLSEYKNTLPTRELPSIQSVFFEPVQDTIKKYLTLESASFQNVQISQSILYHASISAVEFDTYEEINQVISIRGPDTYRASIYNNIKQNQEYAYGFGVAKSRLKFALENGLVDEFVGLIIRFIENHTGVDTNKRMTVDITQIENPKKLKHKGRPKLPKPAQQNNQDLKTRSKSRQIAETDTEDEYSEESSSQNQANNDTNNGNCSRRHCGNCYRSGHYSSTCHEDEKKKKKK